MTKKTPKPSNAKLLVQFRLESGCLGPNGDELIENFCLFAQNEFKNFCIEFARWQITPRFDKSLPEIQYQINGKRLDKKQISKYLHIFNQTLSNFEESLDDKIAGMIDLYLSH